MNQTANDPVEALVADLIEQINDGQLSEEQLKRLVDAVIWEMTTGVFDIRTDRQDSWEVERASASEATDFFVSHLLDVTHLMTEHDLRAPQAVAVFSGWYHPDRSAPKQGETA